MTSVHRLPAVWAMLLSVIHMFRDPFGRQMFSLSQRQLFNTRTALIVGAASVLNVYKNHLMINVPVLMTGHGTPYAMIAALDISTVVIILLAGLGFDQLRETVREAAATGRSWRELMAAPFAVLVMLYLYEGLIQMAGAEILYVVNQLTSTEGEFVWRFIATCTFAFGSGVLLLIMWALRLRLALQVAIVYGCSLLVTMLMWGIARTSRTDLQDLYVGVSFQNIIIASVLLLFLHKLGPRFAER